MLSAQFPLMVPYKAERFSKESGVLKFLDENLADFEGVKISRIEAYWKEELGVNFLQKAKRIEEITLEDILWCKYPTPHNPNSPHFTGYACVLYVQNGRRILRVFYEVNGSSEWRQGNKIVTRELRAVEEGREEPFEIW